MNKNVKIANELIKIAKELTAVGPAPYTDSQIKLLENHGFKKVDNDYELTLDEFTLKTRDNSCARPANILIPVNVTINGNRIIDARGFILESKEIMKILADFGYKSI